MVRVQWMVKTLEMKWLMGLMMAMKWLAIKPYSQKAYL
jgi:hypothetical protein